MSETHITNPIMNKARFSSEYGAHILVKTTAWIFAILTWLFLYSELTKLEADKIGIALTILAAFGSPIFIYIAHFPRVSVTEDAVVSRKPFFKKIFLRTYYLRDVSTITEDSFLFLHVFHVVSKNGKRNIVSNAIEGYCQLLGEIILRVNPKAFVDDKSLKYADLNREDIGKLYKE